MTQQHLHAKIGDAISQCKKRMFQRLKDGVDLGTAVSLFTAEIGMALDVVLREWQNVSSESVPN